MEEIKLHQNPKRRDAETKNSIVFDLVTNRARTRTCFNHTRIRTYILKLNDFTKMKVNFPPSILDFFLIDCTSNWAATKTFYLSILISSSTLSLQSHYQIFAIIIVS